MNATCDVELLPVDRIDPHPQNPGRHRIDDESTAQLAESIRAVGLLQAIRVRPVGKRWQVVFGHRRFQAVRALGWDEVPAVVSEYTDGQALEAMGVENAQRIDLDPIAVAEHLQAMLLEQPDGSPALTQAQAGQAYGISQAEVSNRVRLLRLPELAREAVISGEMSPKQARQLVPLADVPELVEAVVRAFRDDCSQGGYLADEWEAGEPFEQAMLGVVYTNTRPVDGTTRHYYGYGTELAGDWPRLFELTDDARLALGVVALPIGERPGKGKPRDLVEVATNVEHFDSLNGPLILEQKAKGRTKPAADPADRSPAEEKAHRAKQTKARRDKRLELDAETARRLLRCAIAREVQAGDWRTRFAAQAVLACCPDPSELVQLATWECLGQKGRLAKREAWTLDSGGEVLAGLFKAAAEDGDEVSVAEQIEARVVQLALVPVHDWAATSAAGGCVQVRASWEWSPADPLRNIKHGLLEQLAAAWGVEVARGWEQSATAGVPRRIVEQFLGYLQKPELVDLAAELGVELDKGATAKAARLAILADHQAKIGALALPACLQATKPARKWRKRR